jgi:hypothetical protein
MHSPLEHVVLQESPHPPQLFLSVDVVTQEPLQFVVPVGQTH